MFLMQSAIAWGRPDGFCKRHRRRGRSAGPEGERGVSTPPSLPLDTPLPATRKGLLAPFRPQRGRLHPKILKIHAIRREDLFTVFSASADLKGPSVAARQLPGGERCRKRHLICCALAAGQQQPMPLPVTTLPVKKQIRRGRSPAGFAKSKIMFLLKMPRATRRAFQIVSLAVTVTSSAASRRRRHPPGTRRRKSRSCRRPTARPASGRWGTWPARADGALPPPRPHGCCRTR